MIYADYNATSPLTANARSWMDKALEFWGNPSSIHQAGQKSRQIVEESREVVAKNLGVSPSQIIFTSGGSEANTLALWGLFLNSNKPFKILSSEGEHSSVTGTLKFLEKQGASVQKVKLLPTGALDMDDFLSKFEDFKPHLVSIMTVNNETGILFPAPQIFEKCLEKDVLFHTDAVQAFGKLEKLIQPHLFSVSAHKIGGPKGIGALICNSNIDLHPVHFGGPQETKRRGGTQNIIGILGFAGACLDLPDKKRLSEIESLRNIFEELLKKNISNIEVIGKNLQRVPNTSNIHFEGIRADLLLSALDLSGLCASAGSACQSGSINPSPVLLAMGKGEKAKEHVRFSFGCKTSLEDIHQAITITTSCVQRMIERKRA